MFYPFWQSGNAQVYPMPEQMRQLPFTLLRSHLYPRRPGLVAQAARDYEQGAPAPIAYLPKTMVFDRYTSGPIQLAYGSRTRGLMDALTGPAAQYRALYNASMGHGQVPVQPYSVAALRYNQVPVPAVDQHMRDIPMGRNAMPADAIGQGMSDPRRQQEVLDAAERTQLLSGVDSRTRALGEIFGRAGGRRLFRRRALRWR